jgi:hypothetical protein
MRLAQRSDQGLKSTEYTWALNLLGEELKQSPSTSRALELVTVLCFNIVRPTEKL